MTEEPLYEARAKITSVTVKEFVPNGVRVSMNLQGEVEGKYTAARLETSDLLLQPDGTGEIEARFVDMTAEGEAILVSAKGTTKMVNPTTSQAQGTESFKTASKTHAWLNAAQARFEAVLDLSTGGVVAKAYITK